MSAKGGKSQNQIREEIIEDWADVRQWIDDLQQDWVNRHESAELQKEDKPQQTRRRTSSGK